MRNTLIPLIVLFLFAGCKKETIVPLLLSKGVFIVSEGNFNFGNGEVSFYNPETKQITNNIFSAANGFPVGDVVQSLYVKDSLGFIVVNNSAKVEVVKLPSFQRLRTISIVGSSPRYFIAVTDSIGYVSELYANRIWVVNYMTGALVGNIQVPQYTEHLIKIGGHVYAEGKKIYSDPNAKGALMKIRISDHAYVGHRQFAGDMEGIVKDSLNRIWILTGEDTATSTTAAIRCFDENLNLTYSYSFGQPGARPKLLQIHKSDNSLWYAIGSEVYGVGGFQFPGYPYIQSTATNIYAMGVDPVNGDIYVSDPLDFVQRSRVIRYNKHGEEIDSFTGGVICGDFSFYQ